MRGADVAAAVRADTGESVVVVIAPGLDPLAFALAKAAIGPLAIERAPARVNAVVEGENADPDAVGAAIAFLENARSTTGQVIEVCQSSPARGGEPA